MEATGFVVARELSVGKGVIWRITQCSEVAVMEAILKIRFSAQLSELKYN